MENPLASQNALPKPSYLHEEEIGFYVVCDDHSMLERINSLMRKRGILGVSDTAGRVHYLVDGRQGSSFVLNRIEKQLCKMADGSYSATRTCTPPRYEVEQAVNDLLRDNHVNMRLQGAKLLQYLLVEVYFSPDRLTAVTKNLYPLAVKEYGMTISQIERNLRYAIQRSSMTTGTDSNTACIHRMLQLLHEKIWNQYRSSFERNLSDSYDPVTNRPTRSIGESAAGRENGRIVFYEY
ncbi:MAG TPA: sporulation initiation factor Spo0A C-terminal domain-containing protein [Bacillota bacterium]|nr:sporulation initiation factor Spo0A C-terminal domain-containing protein [Bacillota bacterium]